MNNNWSEKEKYLDLCRKAGFAVNLDPPNGWHVIIGGESCLERFVKLVKEESKK